MKTNLTVNEVERIKKLTEIASEHFNRKYGNCLDKSHWRFLVNDVFSTGEGRTISLLITQSLPGMGEDFDVEHHGYHTINTKEYRAIREFYEIFGEFNSQAVEFLPEDHFFGSYSNCLPSLLQNVKNSSYYRFYSQLHFNLT